MHCSATALHEVERNVKRSGVSIVAVIDYHATVLSLLNLKAHCYGLKLCHTLGDYLGRNHQVQGCCKAVDGVLNRGVVDERYAVAALNGQVTVLDGSAILLACHRLNEERALIVGS